MRNIPHEAIIDFSDRSAISSNDVGICPRHADSRDAHPLQLCHNIFVYQTGVDHSHHAQHVSICDATASDHLCFDTELSCHVRCRPSAAMHQHFVARQSRKGS